MGNNQETMTRRQFIIYHMSPILTAAGALIAVAGRNELSIADRTRDDLRRNSETYIRPQIGDAQCATASVEEKKGCVEQTLKEYDTALNIVSELKWSEVGGPQAENKTHIGLGLLAIGIGIKLADSFLQRRSLYRKKNIPPPSQA